MDPSQRATCQHVWVANNGTGGDPTFTVSPDRSMHPTMPAKCSRCSARAQFTPWDWHLLPVPGDNRATRRRREREAEAMREKADVLLRRGLARVKYQTAVAERSQQGARRGGGAIEVRHPAAGEERAPEVAVLP